MIPACHSVATLKEMLQEASARLVRSPRGASRRIDALQRAIDESEVVSASVEQEIVSLCILAELEEHANAKANVANVARGAPDAPPSVVAATGNRAD